MTTYTPSTNAQAGDRVCLEFLDNAMATIEYFEVREDKSVWVVVSLDDGTLMTGPADGLCQAGSA